MTGDPAPGWTTDAVRSDPANGVVEPYDGIDFVYQGQVMAGVPVPVGRRFGHVRLTTDRRKRR